ncbi:hypothetical protein [Haloglycomyces albus]|uniref:hypothetical protein n=1 Tax=Haloglycomyces albus TaxID=526067 RepID=UPI00046CBF6D|nr:hypothetical protein [Haloglycomyces albus]
MNEQNRRDDGNRRHRGYGDGRGGRDNGGASRRGQGRGKNFGGQDRGGRGGSQNRRNFRDDRGFRGKDGRGRPARKHDRGGDKRGFNRDKSRGDDGFKAEGRHDGIHRNDPAVRLTDNQGAPDLPEGLEYGLEMLDGRTRAALRTLNKQLAELVGNRMIATAALLPFDPEAALEQAKWARKKASRVAEVREVVGVAAYHAGEWSLALSELRAAQRLSGTLDLVAMIADAERAAGHPERAVDLHREHGKNTKIDVAVRVELLIVAAGARSDMGQKRAATTMLKVPALHSARTDGWVARLRFAYAEALLAEGQYDDARAWLEQAAAADENGESGAAERLLELDGVNFEDVELAGENASEQDDAEDTDERSDRS